MKLWIDLSNAPHAHFFKKLIHNIEEDGEHELVVTARSFGYLEDLLEELSIEAQIVGSHGGKSIQGKLDASLERQSLLAHVIKKEKPDKFLCKHSVEGMRVAYGLGLDSTLVVDNEHGHAMNNLFVPLATRIIIPEVAEPAFRTEFGNRKFIPFKGISEVANVEEFKPDKRVLEELGVTAKKLLTIRTGPLDAHYFNDNGSNLADFVRELDFTVVAFPRNGVDSKALKKVGVIIPPHGTDTLSLSYYSDAFLGEGGTMNREAALLGTPTISCYPEELLAVDQYLIHEGLMQHSLDKTEIRGFIEHADKNAARKKATHAHLESPLPIIQKELGI